MTKQNGRQKAKERHLLEVARGLTTQMLMRYIFKCFSYRGIYYKLDVMASVKEKSLPQI